MRLVSENVSTDLAGGVGGRMMLLLRGSSCKDAEMQRWGGDSVIMSTKKRVVLVLVGVIIMVVNVWFLFWLV